MRRGWIGFVALVGLLGRTVVLALLFWGVHPLWLTVFWGVQGYPTTLGDLGRWYALGVFNAVPALAWLMLGLVLMAALSGLRARLSRRGAMALGALIGGLIAPPLAYVLLLLYAGVWRYRAWDVMMPALLHAYLMLAPSCALVGAIGGGFAYRWRKDK